MTGLVTIAVRLAFKDRFQSFCPQHFDLTSIPCADLKCRRIAGPYQASSFFIDPRVCEKPFILKIIEIGVIEVESSSQSAIGYPPLALEQFEDLGKHMVEVHDGLSA